MAVERSVTDAVKDKCGASRANLWRKLVYKVTMLNCFNYLIARILELPLLRPYIEVLEVCAELHFCDRLLIVDSIEAVAEAVGPPAHDCCALLPSIEV